MRTTIEELKEEEEEGYKDEGQPHDPNIYCDQCSRPQWENGIGLCSWRNCAETGSCDGTQHLHSTITNPPSAPEGLV